MTKEIRNENVEKLEVGTIYFIVKPKVNQEKLSGEEDIQRFHMVLAPKDTRQFRSIIVGHKKLPGITEHNRYWGYVNALYQSEEKFHQEFEGGEHETKTRGTQHEDPARVAGEGVYAFVTHGDHTHFIYELNQPRDTGEVQEDLNIKPEGSYIVSVKNPKRGAPKSAGLPRTENVEYPQNLQQLFDDKRFISVSDTKLLDYEGAEVVLIGSQEEVSKELGIELDENKRYHELHLDKGSLEKKPMKEGKWQ
ncbi:MAG: hypothetical protein ACOCXT_02845 [Candidatus Dojkabacteria bacterium]